MRAVLAEGLRRARAGGRRTVLAAVGVALAAAMLGTAVTVAYSLSTGFERAADRADLPDVLARFAFAERAKVDERVRALPNLAAREYRTEFTRIRLRANGERTRRGVVHAVRPGRRGYAVVEGRDVRFTTEEVVVERGVAREWDLEVGDRMRIEDLGSTRVVGIAVGPDNVAFPLASAPRVYLSAAGLERRFGGRLPVNVALLWTRDRDRVDVTLQQARATSFGIADLRFVTRDGVRVLIDRAAGIVIALLVALSLVALGAAGVMLGVAAHADVQRRLPALGVQRAIGFDRRTVAGAHAVSAGVVALPAGAAGLAMGALLAAGPTGGLLATLNELAPGRALLWPLAAALALTVATVTAATAWPAWRAAGCSPVALLRGTEIATPRRPRTATGGPLRLGARLALARRGRYAGTVGVLAVCVAVVALLVAMASLLTELRDDPGSLGKRYDLTVALPAADVPRVVALPGVEAATPRYVAEAADSFALGETLLLIALGGAREDFEAPPLAEGRRVAGDREVEIGLGLAGALGIGVGGTLAAQLPSGAEARFRVVGIVRALANDGRVGYVRPAGLLAGEPGLDPMIAVRLERGADRAAVDARLRALGAAPAEVGGATSDDRGLLGTLAALLRAVAGVIGLVCLYALAQALALVALERRRMIAILRAGGAGPRTVAALLAGVVAVAAIPALALGLVLERALLAPLVGRLAAGYADLEPRATSSEALLVGAGLAVLAAAAAVWTAWRASRRPIVAGLRED